MTEPGAPPARSRASAFLTVAAAASLWGTAGILRATLAVELPASTVVAYEHALLVLATLPWVPAAVRTFLDLSRRSRVAVVAIGAGASALATTLFTAAFRYGDPTSPLLLQKLQPVVAILLAAWLLGERPRRRFVPLASIALAGGYLVSFPDPGAVTVERAAPALLALAAAALWAGGTVLGRALVPRVPPMQLTALRFLTGLPVAWTIAVWQAGFDGVRIEAGDVGPLALLALGPGLLALTLYYRGLRGTPASLATLAELAFPLTAVGLGALVLGQRLVASQWLGILLLVGAIALLAVTHRARPLVRIAEPAHPALTLMRPPT